MIGVEHVVVYLWQEWIRKGRVPDAAWRGITRELRPTRRYTWSLTFVFLLVSALLYWLVELVAQMPDEPGLVVLLAAAGIIWTLASGGTANAYLERIVLDSAGIARRSLLGGQRLAWTEIAQYEFPAGRDVILVSAAAQKLRISSNLDGLDTLLAELARRAHVPSLLEERLACEVKAKPPVIAR